MLYLGLGLFLTDFLPYFLHLNPSSMMSTSDFVLNATRDAPPPLPPSDAPLLHLATMHTIYVTLNTRKAHITYLKLEYCLPCVDAAAVAAAATTTAVVTNFSNGRKQPLRLRG